MNHLFANSECHPYWEQMNDTQHYGIIVPIHLVSTKIDEEPELRTEAPRGSPGYRRVLQPLEIIRMPFGGRGEGKNNLALAGKIA